MTVATCHRWRAEFPIVETCTYLVSHSLGAMPRKTAAYLQQFADTWSTRGVRAWHEGWWEVGRETGNLLAPILGVATNTISMHQNVTVAQGDHRLVLHLRRAAPQDRDERSGVPVEPLPVRGVPPLRRRDRLRAVRRIRSASTCSGFSTRSTSRPCSCRCRWCCSRAPCITDARAVIEKAHRVGAHVILDVYQGAGTVPMDAGGLERRLRGRRIGEVAVRRTGRRLSLRAAGSRGDGCSPRSSAGPPMSRRSTSRPGPIRYAGSPERFQSGTPNVPSLYSARAGYEIVAVDRRAGHPRAIAGAHAPDHRRGAGRRLSPEHAAGRPRARRVGDPRRPECRGSRRRVDRAAASSSTTVPAPASAWRRTSTIPSRRSTTRWTTLADRDSA